MDTPADRSASRLDPDYDSDDESRTECDQVDYSRYSKLNYSCSLAVPKKGERGSRGIVVGTGDVVISLSSQEEDSIILRSATLGSLSPFWKASLSDNWAANKTTGEAGIKRLELDFSTISEAMLVGKTRVTPPVIRDQKLDALINAQDVDALNDFQEGTLRCRRFIAEQHIAARIAAHKIAFAIVCGHPPKTQIRRRHSQCLFTLVAYYLLDWIQDYGSFVKMRDRAAQYILQKGGNEMRYCPFTYMRIACLLKSKDLYQEALAAAVASYHQDWLREQCYHAAASSHSSSAHNVTSALGIGHRLAKYVFDQHTLQLNLLDADLDNIQLSPTSHLAKDRKINHISSAVFHHWLKSESPCAYPQHPYQSLTRDNLDVGSIVGHWRARLKRSGQKLPRNIEVADIVVNTQRYFDAAAPMAWRMFDDNDVFTSTNSQNWELSAKNVCIGDVQIPWVRGVSWDSKVEHNDSILTKVSQNVALGDVEFQREEEAAEDDWAGIRGWAA